MSSRLCVVLALSGLMVLPGVSASLLPIQLPASSSLIVGYAHGEKDAALALLAPLGVTVTGSIDALDALLVSTPLPPGTVLSLVGTVVSFVEPDLGAAQTGAQWDGAQWDGAQWNGAQWDGAQWNGAQWDGSGIPIFGPGFQYGLFAIRAPAAWAAATSRAPATLCVVDSGVDGADRDLAGRVTGDATDPGGHGTHMAGIASAIRGDAWGVAGVSNASVRSMRALDATGHGKESDVARAMVGCVGTDVVLLALSTDGRSKLIDRAITLLDEGGTVLVASAGNEGPCSSCVTYPASDPRVIAVAAVDANGALASFSSRGPEVDVNAPGVRILSDLPGDRFAYGSGTSQSAAFVAGAAALLREVHPGLAPAAVRDAVVAGARAGNLDAAGALASLQG